MKAKRIVYECTLCDLPKRQCTVVCYGGRSEPRSCPITSDVICMWTPRKKRNTKVPGSFDGNAVKRYWINKLELDKKRKGARK